MDAIQNLLDIICGDNYDTNWRNLNYRDIPTTAINATVGSETEFNQLYQELLHSDYKQIVRTKSGGISIKRQFRLYNHHIYDIKQYNSVIELTICKPVDDIMRCYRVQYRNNNYKDKDNKEDLISGTVAFRIFTRELAKDGIDITKYAISEELGKKINKEIHAPDIRLFNPLLNTNRVFMRAHHLDFHKFYISGLACSHKEFRPTIERLAKLAKSQPVYKTVLAATIGYMHSPACKYKYAKLARDAINNAYTRYDAVLKVLSKDHNILATNTDGIWYTGEEFHGIYETTELGGWSTDHRNVQLRFKSAGSYEFIEDGIYFPVVRGRTRLDNIKSRDTWRWGDIFDISAAPLGYKFEEGEGIIWRKIM